MRIYESQSEDVYESLGGDQRNYAEWKKPTQKVTDCMIPFILPVDTHNNIGGMQENYDEWKKKKSQSLSTPGSQAENRRILFMESECPRRKNQRYQ